MIKLFKRKAPPPPKWRTNTIDLAGGISFKYFEDPLVSPHLRVAAYFDALHETQLGIQRKHFNGFYELQAEALNDGNFTKAASLLEYLKAFADLYANEENIFKLGNTFIMLPEENPVEMHGDFTAKKYQLLKSNEDVRAFFLSTAWLQIERWSKSETSINILAYLDQPLVKQSTRIFLSLISSYLLKPTEQK